MAEETPRAMDGLPIQAQFAFTVFPMPMLGCMAFMWLTGRGRRDD